ncbi:MAG: hypothetical protein A4E41_00315 [Methanoregulaceae archaeon PtaU1.Bin066]|nr:MAG: hypothetical protein A4E41_00315 [Methanoregulaceae archaeon PtaU1.Bin066]
MVPADHSSFPDTVSTGTTALSSTITSGQSTIPARSFLQVWCRARYPRSVTTIAASFAAPATLSPGTPQKIARGMCIVSRDLPAETRPSAMNV